MLSTPVKPSVQKSCDKVFFRYSFSWPCHHNERDGEPFVQAQIKENINAPRHWSFSEEQPPGDRGFPLTMGQ